MRFAADVSVPWRVPLLVLAFASLLLGIDAGLRRLGWSIPAAGLAAMHGPLMASGFFGTVISLERAVALRRRWAYAAPLLSGLATVAAVATAPLAVAAAFATAGSAVMVAASASVYRRQRELFTLTLALGAAAWLAGNLVWLAAQPIYAAAPWWIAFLVLTIAGERLELSRLMPPSPRAKRVFAALAALLLGGVAVAMLVRPAGTVALGAALVGLAAWLMRQDVARRTVRTRGLTRFIAVCLLSGYVWLALSGVTMLASGGLGFGGFGYDAALHAVLLGFVFAMVFGHAPIILPAVLRVAVPYSPWFYVPLALLHGSLVVRLAGDWMGSPEWRAWGGALNGVALLAFMAATIGAVVRGLMARGTKPVRGAHAAPGGGTRSE
jgi:hypothetical protein